MSTATSPAASMRALANLKSRIKDVPEKLLILSNHSQGLRVALKDPQVRPYVIRVAKAVSEARHEFLSSKMSTSEIKTAESPEPVLDLNTIIDNLRAGTMPISSSHAESVKQAFQGSPLVLESLAGDGSGRRLIVDFETKAPKQHAKALAGFDTLAKLTDARTAFRPKGAFADKKAPVVLDRTQDTQPFREAPLLGDKEQEAEKAAQDIIASIGTGLPEDVSIGEEKGRVFEAITKPAAETIERASNVLSALTEVGVMPIAEEFSQVVTPADIDAGETKALNDLAALVGLERPEGLQVEDLNAVVSEFSDLVQVDRAVKELSKLSEAHVRREEVYRYVMPKVESERKRQLATREEVVSLETRVQESDDFLSLSNEEAVLSVLNADSSADRAEVSDQARVLLKEFVEANRAIASVLSNVQEVDDNGLVQLSAVSRATDPLIDTSDISSAVSALEMTIALRSVAISPTVQNLA